MDNLYLSTILRDKKKLKIFTESIGGNEELSKLLKHLDENNLALNKFSCNLSEEGFLGYQADYMDYENMVFIPIFLLKMDMLQIMRFSESVEMMKNAWMSRDIDKYIVLLHRRYYSIFTRKLAFCLTDEFDKETLWSYFEHIWIDSEYLNGHVDKEMLLQLFSLNPHIKKERRALKRLCDKDGYITIYRGEASKSSHHLKDGISWTLSLNKATWFANRYETDECAVYKTRIKPGQVLSHITSRSENEIIFDAVEHNMPIINVIDEL